MPKEKDMLSKADEVSDRGDRTRQSEDNEDPHRGTRQTPTQQQQGGTPVAPLKRLLKLPEVIERVRMGRSTILRYVTQGKFPAPIKNPAGVNLWRESEIEEQVRLMGERDGKQEPEDPEDPKEPKS